MGDGECKSVEHGYMTKTLVFPSATLTAAVADGVATTFTVADSSQLVVGDMLRATSTGEVVRVMAVTNATTIEVRRGTGQIAAAAIGNGVVLYNIGNAHEQGSVRPTSRLMNPVRVLNFTQIFRNSWQLPKTLTATMPIVGGSLPMESREDCVFFHSSDIEKAIIFGQRSGQVVNNQYLTTMDGIVESVRRLAPAANTTTLGATTNFTQLKAALDPCFNTVVTGRNTSDRVFFTGGTGINVVNEIGRLSGQYQIVDGQTSFGLQFSTFKLPRGTFRMIEHALLNSNPTWARMGLAVHMDSLKLKYLRRTAHLEYGMNNVPVDNGIDAVGGTITSELTLENINPSAHCVLYNFTAAAAG